MKVVAFGNTDKTRLPGNEPTDHCCHHMASGCVSNTVTVMKKITVTQTFLTSGRSTEECHHINKVLLSGFLFG